MKRRAFSLLEVLLAIAILGACLAAISGLVRLGAHSAVRARELTSAQLLCEAKMAEITAGILPPDPGGPWNFDLPEDAGWEFYVDLEPLPQPGLMSLRVTVVERIPFDQLRQPLVYSLVRWIQDPLVEFVEPMLEETNDF
jgi:general secretion pathway protein I